MGMDFVELLMTVEERFGIDIPDGDAQHLRTAGALHAYVLGCLRRGPDPGGQEPGRLSLPQLKAEAGRKLVQFLRDRPGLDGAAVRPEASLHRIIPWNLRRPVWEELKREAGLPLPALVRPGWVWAGLAGLWILAAAGLYAWRGGWILPAAAGVLLVPLSLRATLPLARSFPRGTRTPAALAAEACRRGEGRLAARAGGDIWPVLQGVVAEVLGVKPDRVTPQARFVEDLGAE